MRIKYFYLNVFNLLYELVEGKPMKEKKDKKKKNNAEIAEEKEVKSEKMGKSGITEEDRTALKKGVTEKLFEDVYTNFKLHFYKEVFKNFESREATLTTVETFCMEVIYALDNPTVNQFATFIGISSPNAAYKINNLIKKGYLNKVQSDNDKREYHLQVTEKYINYYNVSASYVSEVLKSCRESMSDKEWSEFYHALSCIEKEQEKTVKRPNS